MPANKKPRHPHRAKGPRSVSVTAAERAGIISAIRFSGLQIEMSLPQGVCDAKDIKNIRHFFNWLGFLIATSNSFRARLDDRAYDYLNDAVNALIALEKDKEAGVRDYVCRPDELRAIQEGYAYFKPPMEHMLEFEAVRAVNAFDQMMASFWVHKSKGAPGRVVVGSFPTAKGMRPLKHYEG